MFCMAITHTKGHKKALKVIYFYYIINIIVKEKNKYALN